MYYHVHLQSAEYIGICTHGGLLRICCAQWFAVCIWYGIQSYVRLRDAGLLCIMIRSQCITLILRPVCVLYTSSMCVRVPCTHTQNTHKTHTHTHTHKHTHQDRASKAVVGEGAEAGSEPVWADASPPLAPPCPLLP